MDNKEIRFIDSHYNELFRIKDGESITVTLADGAKTDRKCTYLDDYHTQIGFNKFHICEFAEIMERGGSTYRPKDTPSYSLEKIDQSEFEYMYKLSDESQNRGCICYIRGYFDNSIDERLQTTAMVENKENYNKYKTQDFSIECDNIINYLRFQSDTPVLQSRIKMHNVAYDTKAERYSKDTEISGYRITTKENTYYLRCDARRGQYNFYMYCYNTKAFDKFRNTQFVEQHYDKTKRDVFLKTDGGVTEVYYNPDSNAGGQLVYIENSKNNIIEAAKVGKTTEEFFSHLEGIGNGYLVDIDTPEFRMCFEDFMKCKADFEGCNKKTMNGLKKHAGIEPTKKHNHENFER